MIKSKLNKYSNVIAWLITIYIVEIVMGCSGRWIDFGYISIRMLLFISCVLFTTPYVFANFKKTILNPQIISIFLLFLYLILSAIIGLKNNNKFSFIFADITGFLKLALYPGLKAFLSSKEKLNRCLKTIYIASVLLALITVFLHFLFAFAAPSFIRELENNLAEKSMGGIALLQTGIYRIYLRSQIFFQVAILLGAWAIIYKKDIQKKLIYLCEGILLFALILTYTRGFWLGFAISAIIVLIAEFKNFKKLLLIAGIAFLVTVVLFVASTVVYQGPKAFQEVINRFDPSLTVMFSDDTTEFETEEAKIEENNKGAVELRAATLMGSWKKISQKPIIGNGLGTNLDGIREDGKTEYMYLDIIMKMGIIGFILFCIVFFEPVFVQIKNQIMSKKIQDSEWIDFNSMNKYLVASYVGILITSYVNPFLLNPMGVTLFILTGISVHMARENINMVKMNNF